MSNSEHDAQERERQYQIDAITYRYAEEHRAGREPRVEEYAARYPQYAAELTEFALYFPAVGADLPTAEAAPDPTLSPAAAAVLARIHTEHAAPVPAEVPATDGLVAQAARVGLAPRALAEAVRLSTELLARLEAHSIDAATIPPHPRAAARQRAEGGPRGGGGLPERSGRGRSWRVLLRRPGASARRATALPGGRPGERACSRSQARMGRDRGRGGERISIMRTRRTQRIRR